MRKYQNRTQWVLFLCLTVGLATPLLTHAAQPKNKHGKNKPDPEAEEAKQAAQEEAGHLAEWQKDGRNTNDQSSFVGKFVVPPVPTDPSDGSQEKLSPDVVGMFFAASSDKKPGRTYLVKVENGSKAVLATLKRNEGKTTQILGKLRVIGPDGEAKYLIVSSVIETEATPPPVEHRKFGGS